MDYEDNKITLVKSWRDHLIDNGPWLVVFGAMVFLVTKAVFNAFVFYMTLAGTFLFFRYRYVYINNPSFRYLVILFACIWAPMLVAMIDAVEWERSGRTLSAHLMFLFAGLYVIYIGYDPKKASRLTLATVYLVLFWCIDAMIQFAFGRDLFGLTTGNDLDRLTGLFSPMQRLGLVVACMSPLVYEWARINYTASRFYLLAPVLVTVVVILSGSRSAWVMLLFSYLIYGIYLIHFIGILRAIKVGLIGIAALAVLSLLAYQTKPVKYYANQTAQLFKFDYNSIENATGNRLSLWITAFNIGKENWFNGVGPRGYRFAYDQYRGERDTWHLQVKEGSQQHAQHHPHQTFLEVFAETGLVGVIGFIIFLAILFKLIFRCIKEAYYEPIPWLMGAFLAFNPINAHKALYSNYWSTVAWILLLVGISSYREFKVNRKTAI